MEVEERLEKFLKRGPTIAPGAFVAADAQIIGDVRIGEEVSVWPKSVLRGDINFIEIGRGSNIQDGSLVHLSDECPVVVGEYVTIGHGAMLHGCRIEDACLIGMRATVLDGACIGKNSIVGAGAVVLPRTQIPPGSLVVGTPAIVKQKLSIKQQSLVSYWAKKYIRLSQFYKKEQLIFV